MSSEAIKTTVELFGGIGGFRLAAAQNGLQTLWANDICPKACQVYQSRFGDAEIRQGDIRELTHEIPSHDLLTAGFPCQPFSSAGQKKGFRDPRGMIFSVIVDILKAHRPPYFILENVKRLLLMEKGIHFATVLSALTELGYHIEWRLVNARHFGLAQNRERVLILGSLDVNDNHPTIRLASLKDLCDSLESNFRWVTDMSSWIEIEKHRRKFANWGLAFRQRFFACDLEHFSEAEPVVTLRSILQPTVDPTFDFTESTIQRLEESTRINRFLDGVQLLYNQKRGARMGYTVFGIDGIAPTLTAATSRHYERYKVGDRYRRLTNVEYARLQGFPDDHCSAVSIYNQYALYGNAIPPVFASWVLNKILENRVTSLENVKGQQLHLFQEFCASMAIQLRESLQKYLKERYISRSADKVKGCRLVFWCSGVRRGVRIAQSAGNSGG